ncbi:MAG: PEP-CTERM sorting domain-containing protein [Phycisphaeraceae bacterium]|nr:PEP-CTERM sorting domain-containing protein [Phycisphaeraceae bacterium]
MQRTFFTLGLMCTLALAAASARAALVAQYQFNEAAGPTVADNIGSADGTATAGVSFVTSGAGVSPGIMGNAGSFDGVSSAVNFGTGAHPASFDLGTGDFTISGWMKMPTNTVIGAFGNKPLFQNINYSGGGWVFEVGRSDRSYAGKVFFTVGGGSSAVFSLTQAFSDVRLDNSTWHWIAVTNSSGAINMYVDGVLQVDTGAMQVGTSTATSPAATEAQFGARGIAQALFDGQLDDWRIYTEALSGTLDGNNTLTGGGLYDVWQAPEPATLGLLGIGLVTLLRTRRR